MDNRPVSTARPSLGDTLQVFKPAVANIIAGLVISLILTAAGCAALLGLAGGVYQAGGDLPIDGKRMSWLLVGLGSFLGVIVLGGGVWLGAYSRGLLSHRVEVCTEGIRYHDRAGAEDVPWGSVTGIREIIIYARPPIVKGPARMLLPEIANTSFVVVTRSGREHLSDGNTVKAIKRFGRAIREQANRRSVPWQVVESHV